jgi:parallel beta-helix repeat protein
MGLKCATMLISVRLTAVIVGVLLPLSAAAAGTVSVTVNPGDDIQAAVDAHPPGTVYNLQAGIHRMQSIVPKEGDVFDGHGTAVLNGSRLLTVFDRVGNTWVASGQTQEGYVLETRPCQPAFPRCSRPEDVYVDDKPLHHVDNLYEVIPGAWYFNYRTNKAYLGDDPAGRKVEIGVTAQAFGGKASNVTVRNLTIEKYAAPLTAVDAGYGTAWIVENNIIRLNHAVAVNAGPNSKILRNRLVHNGQQAFDGDGRNFLFEGNEIAHNNYAGVDFEWEAGGGKVTATQGGAVIRGNCVHGNDGPGIWADENVRGLVIEDNVVFDNSANGIMYEISYDGVIRNNLVADNGKRKFRWFWGPQILVSGASNVQVYGNRVDVPADYGNAITIVAQNRSPYPAAAGNQIFNNTIVMRGTEARVGAATDVAAYAKIVATKNAMRQNEYHVADLTTAFWHWNDKDLNWAQIKSEGQEEGSTIDAILPPKPQLDCAFLRLP